MLAALQFICALGCSVDLDLAGGLADIWDRRGAKGEVVGLLKIPSVSLMLEEVYHSTHPMGAPDVRVGFARRRQEDLMMPLY
jgi:hypothetical protein